MPGGKRDRDESERRLIAAVGSILKRKGHSGLGVNRVAMEAEVSKPMIYDYFGTLNNLLHAYIKKKDYWLPLFDSLQLPDPKDPDAVRELITATLQQQFSFFYQEPEMQKLILWQITEEHPLLRSVSDRREAEGAKVLALAEPHFRHSGISPKAVTALLVGGIYYMVLHAHSNKSTVCGIDVNQESDKRLVVDTIAQVLQWAWSQASANKTETIHSTNMSYEFELLENLTAQLVARVAGGYRQTGPDAMLKNEVKRLERVLLLQLMALTNETQITTFLQINLSRLVSICNQLYFDGAGEHYDAGLILELLEAIRKPANAYIPGNIELPKLFREQEGRNFAQQWQQIFTELDNNAVDGILAEIVGLPFNRFASEGDKLYWADFKYLKRYAYVLEKMVAEMPPDEILLTDLLIGLGFNHSRFTAYHARQIRHRLSGQDNVVKRSILLQAKAKVSQVESLTAISFERNKIPVKDELMKWIDAELLLYPETPQRPPNSHKLNTTFKAIELAFWRKLEYDHGIYEEANLDIFSEKIAGNFTTIGQDELSGPSIKSKFYTKEPAVVDAAELKLVAMLEDVRKYKR